MKRVLLTLSALGAFLSAQAEIEILYLAPNDTAPVLGSISTDSRDFRTATPVDGKKDWMKVVRKDHYSGFIAKDSLTSDGTVEPGTAMLMTPSKSGKVFTTIEAGDEVSINLVDDWTEITVYKSIPGYFIPEDRKATPPANVSPGAAGQITYANDPLLARANNTRYTAPALTSPLTAASNPIAAQPTIPTSVPMTGFEEVNSLNPAFGRTGKDGQTAGYSLGAGSTPIPREDTTAPFLDTSMEAPTSVAAIPLPTAADPKPRINPPTQAEEVDVLSDATSEEIETADNEAAEVDAGELIAAPAVEETIDSPEVDQEEAMEAIDAGTEEMVGEEGDDSEVIPLAPSAAVVGSAAATSVVASSGPAEEPIQTAPVVIIETEEDVEVANNVAESVVPGVTQPIAEDEPPLIPPTDINRIYIGKLQRTERGFWGSKPKFDFELLNYSGNRIAYVDISEIPAGSYEKFTDQIVQVYGLLVPSGEKDTLLIKAANVTLR
tara:strand:- start:20986 stop:22464 length:1479 start_codon:yes stop_codon:yes gene_type:complete